MGMCEFYSKFVRGLATLAEPLLSLLKKNARFVWGEQQELAFKDIKQELEKAHLLSPYIPGSDTCITMDASNVGIGAVLTQNKRGHEKIIAFAFRTLHPQERSYSVIEKEMLACVWAVGKFRPYVWGMCFLIQTDHKPLVPLLGGRLLHVSYV